MAPQLKVVAVATDTQRDSKIFDTTNSAISVVHESGQIMDQIGFGTWGLKPHEVDSAVRHAVEAGYRLFDLSPVYGNEKEIGQTLTALMAEGKLTRDSIFLTSKVPPADACDRKKILHRTRETLKNLQVDYLDLHLVHWPFCVKNTSTWPPPMEYRLGYSPTQLRQTWSVMEELVDKGLVRHIGLSNLGLHRLQALLDGPEALKVRPNVLQVEHHPYNANRELRAYCASLRPPIRITAYSSLGSATRPAKYQHDQPRLLDDPTIVRIAAKRGASPSAIAMAWAIHDPNVAIIPKSAHADRIASNLLETRAIAAVLRADEMQQLDQLDRGFHYLEEAWKGHAWRPGMTLEELYDDPAPSLFGFSSRLRDLIPLAGVLVCLVYIVQRRAQSRGRWLPVERDED